jgi:hypothetical protein
LALALTACAIIVGDTRALGIGCWSLLLGACVIFAFWLASTYARHCPWRAVRLCPKTAFARDDERHRRLEARQKALEESSLARLAAQATALGAIILFAGVILSQTA